MNEHFTPELINMLTKAPRVWGIAADRNQGKSNLAYHIINELRRVKKFNLLTFGFEIDPPNSTAIRSLADIDDAESSLVVCDEFHRLFKTKTRGAEYTELMDDIFARIAHQKNIFLLVGTAPFFNKYICKNVEGWIIKRVTYDNCVNGSRLKEIVMSNEREKALTHLDIPASSALVYNDAKFITRLDGIPLIKAMDVKANKPEVFSDL